VLDPGEDAGELLENVLPCERLEKALQDGKVEFEGL